MNKKKFTLWVLSMCSFVYSQGAFLDDNMSGFNAGVSVSVQADSSYLGQIQLGYTGLGIIDFNVALGPGKTHQSKDGISGPQKYFAFSPGVSAYVAKQDSQIPISFAFDLSYESDAYRSDYLKRNDLALSGDIYSLGASLYKTFPVSDNVKLTTNVRARYRMERDALGDGWGYFSKSYNDYPQVTAGADALFKESGSSSLRIGAGIGYDRSSDEDNFTLSVTMGVEIGWHDRFELWHHPRRYYIVPAENAVEYPSDNAIRSPKPEPDTLIINIPRLKGGSVSVSLVRYKDGYIGPQGEFYAGRPSVEQLEALYGD